VYHFTALSLWNSDDFCGLQRCALTGCARARDYVRCWRAIARRISDAPARLVFHIQGTSHTMLRPAVAEHASSDESACSYRFDQARKACMKQASVHTYVCSPTARVFARFDRGSRSLSARSVHLPALVRASNAHLDLNASPAPPTKASYWSPMCSSFGFGHKSVRVDCPWCPRDPEGRGS
jgi:hypothetical protein